MADKPEIKRPSLTIDVNGETIKMSYGLQMDIQRMLPDPKIAMALMLADNETQDYVVRRVLTKKNKMLLSRDELIPQEDVDITLDEMEEIIQWVVDHALYFFTNRSSRLAQTAGRYQTAQPSPSKDGSENSPSKTPQGGLLDS